MPLSESHSQKLDFMDKQTNENATRQTQESGVGRTSQTSEDKSNKESAQQDISKVDRQEGEMDNGETGGNFRDGDQNQERQ
jgi:hypothetical protein